MVGVEREIAGAEHLGWLLIPEFQLHSWTGLWDWSVLGSLLGLS